MQSIFRKSRASSFRKFCTKCKKYGNHTEVLCNEPIGNTCIFCARSHSPSKKCSSRLCSKCGENHSENACKLVLSELKCTICNISGHLEELCTNNWRLFFDVTTIEELNNLKPTLPQRDEFFCTKCTSKCHNSNNCANLKNSLQNYNPTPKAQNVNRVKKKILDLLNQKRTLNNETNDFKLPLEEIDNGAGELSDSKNSDNESIVIEEIDDQLNESSTNEAVNQTSVNNHILNGLTDQRVGNSINFIKKKNRKRNRSRKKLVEKNIRSEATKFNQITMKNVNYFVNRRSNEQIGKKHINSNNPRKEQSIVERFYTNRKRKGNDISNVYSSTNSSSKKLKHRNNFKANSLKLIPKYKA